MRVATTQNVVIDADYARYRRALYPCPQVQTLSTVYAVYTVYTVLIADIVGPDAYVRVKLPTGGVKLAA